MIPFEPTGLLTHGAGLPGMGGQGLGGNADPLSALFPEELLSNPTAILFKPGNSKLPIPRGLPIPGNLMSALMGQSGDTGGATPGGPLGGLGMGL